MSIQSEQDFVAISRIGRIVGLTLREMERVLEPGMTTLELDRAGERFLESHGARSAPRLFKNFPGANCISVNDEAVHGVPGARVLRPGDLVKLDVTGELDGYVADACVSVTIPPQSERKRRIAATAESAFYKGAAAARAGRPIYEIGRAVEGEVRRGGFTVLRELHSHGVGRDIHEEPSIPMYFDSRASQRLREGMVLTIEPIIAAGAHKVKTDPDGWTLRTTDGSVSAHYEHTLVITKGQPILITQL